MRVIAGKLGGQKFQSPQSDMTHPMSEKIRGAIFNALGDIEGLSVLDVFAGSGALSIEAISRGASEAVAIDSDRKSQEIIKTNIQRLETGDQVSVIGSSASVWLKENDQQFDIVLMDPPYDKVDVDVIQELARHTKPQGIAIISLPIVITLELADSFELLSSKTYGSAKLVFYRRISD